MHSIRIIATTKNMGRSPIQIRTVLYIMNGLITNQAPNDMGMGETSDSCTLILRVLEVKFCNVLQTSNSLFIIAM